jgi:hypothetical protein
MPNPTTYSFEVNLTRATRIGRAALRSFTEPSTGTKEASFTTVVAPASTVAVGIGDIAEGRMILVNAKPEGGTDDVNALLQITNIAATGVASGTQDIRFGSFIIVADAKFSAVSIKNLDTLNAITVEIFVLGN